MELAGAIKVARNIVERIDDPAYIYGEYANSTLTYQVYCGPWATAPAAAQVKHNVWGVVLPGGQLLLAAEDGQD